MSGYVYWQSEPGLWTVGTVEPGAPGAKVKRYAESDHDSPEQAAARVAYLNGGPLPVPAPDPARFPNRPGHYWDWGKPGQVCACGESFPSMDRLHEHIEPGEPGELAEVDYLSDLLEVARDIRRVLEEIRDQAARGGQA